MNRPLLGGDYYNDSHSPLSSGPGRNAVATRRQMKVAKSPSEALALTNRLVVSPRDFDQKVQYVIINGQFVFTV
jgi:hypothetical protein